MQASVCVVPYNNTQLFFRLLTQLSQTWFHRRELIVIDNSTNPIHQLAIRLLCYSFKERLNVRYYEGRNKKSLSSATNRAVNLSKGKYFIYLCSNHTWIYDPHWLTYMLDEMKSSDSDIGGTLSTAVRPHIQGGIFIAKTAALLEVPFNEKYYPMSLMDVDLSQRFEAQGKRFVQLDRMLSMMGNILPELHNEWEVTKEVLICHSHFYEKMKRNKRYF